MHDNSGAWRRPLVVQPRPSREEAEAAVDTLLRWGGEEPEREGLRDTPARVVRAYEELLAGYDQDPIEILGRVFAEVGGYDDPVLIRDIRFASLCEHHLMPFVGTAHIAYYPQGGVVGLSKIARLVEVFARRLQTQERMTAQIADALVEALQPRGVAVLVEAEHFCMSMRGVAKPGAMTLTSRFTGAFESDAAAQARFMAMIRPFR